MEPIERAMMHISPNRELCTDGQEHDFEGWQDLTDENGNVRGGTTVCTRCGITAFEHSLRYGP